MEPAQCEPAQCEPAQRHREVERRSQSGEGVPMTDLIRSTATEVVGLLRAGDLSPTEVLAVLEEHVLATDDTVNALPIRFFDAARAAALQLERERPAPTDRGWLAGLPVAIKDYNDV